jgi:iron complex outermembrane receptor protein
MADTTSRDFESSYVLDFLQHKADLALTSKEYAGFQLTVNASYQDRVGGYRNAEEMRETPFDPVLLTNLRLRYRYKQVSLYGEVSNLFDQDYVDIGNVQLPGRWVKIGFRFNIH